ncbi:MAG: chromosome segregation protein SMC, partial [Armatimonadota bacterium]
LSMRGFKSFADHTEFEFGAGLTAIVGPNGVGKSNVADAILWVLGEQSNRAIRTQTSQDVIFAGAEKRSALGMAEVRLLLDNEDERLPIDFTEVEVFRRLYRSGESEYGINNSTCRLRDVHDLFVDTGVGQESYSIVGQGEIEAILSVRSEDRRELMEEVAGIGKYRRRRRKAQRKLEATEGNVRRIADIIYELTNQREPLEQAAEKARRYRDLDGELRELELKLLAIDYRGRSERLGKLSNDQSVGKADAEGTRSKLAQLEAEDEKIQAQLHQVENELGKLREQAREAERAAEKTERSHAVNEEKLRSARERLEELEQSDRGDSSRVEELSAQLERLSEQREEIDERGRALAEEIAARREALKELESERREAQSRLGKLQSHQQQRAQEGQNLQREAEAMESLQEELRERVQRLESQRESLREQAEQARARIDEIRQRREQLKRDVEAARERLQELTARHEWLTQTLREHRKKRDILGGSATAAETRLALLQELEASHEGFEDAVRAVMEASESGQLEGVRGVVGGLLEVPGRYEIAIEAALGDRLQWIVVEAEEQALRGIEWLRENEKGEATFMPLATLSSIAPRTASFASGDGCLGVASNLIRAPRDLRHILDHLLGDTLVMQDLEAARRHLKRAGHQCRAVTLKGEVIERGGAIRGGSKQDGEPAQVFSRTREMDQVSAELERLRHALANVWRFEERFEQEAEELSERVEEAANAASDARAELSEAERDAVHVRDQAETAIAAAEEMDDEIDDLRKRVASSAERQQELTDAAQERKAEVRELGAKLEEMRSQQLSSSAIEEKRSSLTEDEVALAELREKHRSLQELVKRTEGELTRARQEVETAARTRAALTEQIEQLEASLAETSESLSEQREHANELREVVSTRAEAVGNLREKAQALEASGRKLRRVLENQQEKVQRAEVALTREQAQLESIRERLSDVYEVSPEEALRRLGEDEPSRQKLARDVNSLKREIRSLGHVNLSAIDECERLSAREEFLKRQRDDLEAAREDIRQIIEEIDTAAEAEFLETFEQISDAFEDTFTTLFEGGRTELYLTDGDNPLESGVEVFAQPKGKKPRHLSLLSGGERAMTALALLFAMLKVKPSPFCVLDEIDAALDASNTDRFVGLLKEFGERSQFIVITHNPRTMEAMDLLHGVTMQEAGVSQRISVELQDAQDMATRDRERSARGSEQAREDTAGVSGSG